MTTTEPRTAPVGAPALRPAAERSGLVGMIARRATLVRYLVIGGGAVVLDVGLFLLADRVFGWHPLLSNTFSTGVAMVASFLANSFGNFRVTDRLWLRFLSFAAVTGAGWLLSTAIIWIAVDVAGLDPVVAKILTLLPVVALQYSLNKKITFAPSTGRNSS
ncbi:GtrA family protein [Microcella flavibacter]|uniref:GtrA family protein n=1 Tax=Microcella flavibacter TaxID=1804990 RepID=UPI0014564FE6|nr:GtrA family protein [Microcella flavibacter]